MANNSKQQILTLHTTHGDKYDAATEQEQNVIGQRIAKARTSMGLSLTKVSALLEDYGVSIKSGAISKWERGVSYPDITLISDICRILDMSEHEFITAVFACECLVFVHFFFLSRG